MSVYIFLIFDIANMRNSGFYETDEIVPNRAIGYYKEENKILTNFFEHSIQGTPAGGSYSTINDMLNFYKSLKMKNLF